MEIKHVIIYMCQMLFCYPLSNGEIFFPSLMSFILILFSVLDLQMRACPLWDLPVIPACLLWLGASLENIWPVPWRKWSTFGRLTVSINHR